jgi:hypothetical protein
MRTSVVSAIAICVGLCFQVFHASEAMAGPAKTKKREQMQFQVRQVGPMKQTRQRGPDIVYLRGEMTRPLWVESQFHKLAERDRVLGNGQKIVTEPVAPVKALPPKQTAKKRKVASRE